MKKMVVGLAILIGCAAPQRQVRLPSGMDSFVVNAFYEGTYGLDIFKGEQLTSQIESELIKRGYTVVDRTQMKSAMTEVKLGTSGAMDEKTIIELGKMVGAKYLIYLLASSQGKTIRCTDLKTMTVAYTESFYGVDAPQIVKKMLNNLEIIYSNAK